VISVFGMDDSTLTKDVFDKLLGWLAPDEQAAAQVYETIRKGLIKFFMCRGCTSPEDLADQVINRVAKHVSDSSFVFVGQPSSYFYGVARKVCLEDFRKRKTLRSFPIHEDANDVEVKHKCLEDCLDTLTARNRDLVIEYYQLDKGDKIKNRRALAERLHVPLGALRIQAYRIRCSLRDCVFACFEGQRSSDSHMGGA
jgi:DNA-directed RNA polymerase specialized sigma24 family protein